MKAPDPKMKISSKPPEETADSLRSLIDLLEGIYGIPKSRGLGPVDILVQTILSQNTTSANTHRAFENLKRRYPDYGALLAAPDEEVAEAIACGGLANIKTRRIKEALQKIRERKGRGVMVKGEERGDPGEGIEPAGMATGIDLGFLGRLDPHVARDYLLSLPGVGPKTAAVVLLFGFSMPFIPVDTHVNRVSRRLGLVPEKATIEEAEGVLEAITPPDKRCSFHVNLIRHGRAVCKARSPLCPGCPLRELCPYPDREGQKG
jgi:endonuclease-3